MSLCWWLKACPTPDEKYDYELHEKVLEHDLAECLRRSVENDTEPAIEPASFLDDAERI